MMEQASDGARQDPPRPDPSSSEPGAPSRSTSSEDQVLLDLWQASCASIKAYEHAVLAVDSEPFRFSLGDMLQRHQHLSEWLSSQFDSRAEDPEESGGLWGNILVFLERVGAALGQRACLSVLQGGENHSLKRARDFLDDASDSDSPLARWIREEWIPALEENRGELDSMLYALRTG